MVAKFLESVANKKNIQNPAVRIEAVEATVLRHVAINRTINTRVLSAVSGINAS